MRSADVGSDHHLLLATCRIRLAACRKKVRKSIKYNIEMLKNPETKQEFRLFLANRFDALRYDSDDEEENEDDIEAEWSTIKEVFTSICEEVLGKIKREKKEWMTQETWDMVEERRILKVDINNSRTRNQKAKAMKAYNAADKRVKRSCRKDKRRWFSDIAAEAEVAASKQDIKTLYKITKTPSGKRRQVNKPVQDKEDRSGPPLTAQMSPLRFRPEKLPVVICDPSIPPPSKYCMF
ncbi:hypothetical protein Bbelb_025020 [Branchiostoma belcheri]|nr:hypothetical protein Bbelb_025020 [Branchiostoma belcheri]